MRGVMFKGLLGKCHIYNPQPDEEKPKKMRGSVVFPITLKIPKTDKDEILKVKKAFIDEIKKSKHLKNEEERKACYKTVMEKKFRDGDAQDEKEYNHGYYMLHTVGYDKPSSGILKDSQIYVERVEKGSSGQIGVSDKVHLVVDIYVSEEHKTLQIKPHIVYLIEKGDYHFMASDDKSRHAVGSKLLGLPIYEDPDHAEDDESVKHFAPGKYGQKKEKPVVKEEEPSETEEFPDFKSDDEKPKKPERKTIKKSKKKVEKKEDDLDMRWE